MLWLRRGTHISVRVQTPHRLSLIAYLAASGLPATQIAQRLNSTPTTVSKHLKSPELQALISEERRRLYDDAISSADFVRLAPGAVAVVTEILRDPDQKGATRLAAATLIIEHAYGKPIQKIETRHSTLKDLFAMLDSPSENKSYDSESGTVQLAATEFTEITHGEELTLAPNADGFSVGPDQTPCPFLPAEKEPNGFGSGT
jgi:DNA-binding MarR family transcriptional regulator